MIYSLQTNKNINKIMEKSKQIVSAILETNYSAIDRKMVSLPLSFGDLPIDILSKQFTKLNNPHSHRIHYLGPRFPNTQTLHKKYAYSQTNPTTNSVPDRPIEKYKLDYKKIVTSFSVNQKLRSNHHYKTGLYYRAFQGMNPTLDLTQQFVFDSAFESGNLDCVIQYKLRQFDCFLRLDSNTRGHSQWYFFSIKNGSRMNKIKINLCNINKGKTLYEKGMEPYLFSKKQFSLSGKGWTQGSVNLTDVKFQQKRYNYKILQGKIPDKAPYCLSFYYEFEYPDDQVYFAYCIPYTYSEMIYDIHQLPSNLCQIHNFAKSLAGLTIPILSISSNNKESEEKDPMEKKNIFITGRIHPGETNGSLMLKGFLQYLCSKQTNAIKMRKRVNFFIIPMINPDGVILGNSRSSAAGKDLNRVFPSPGKQIFPQIYELKNLIRNFLKHRKIFMYYDFHGHSRKKNTFSYGPAYSLNHPNFYKARILLKIIQSLNNGFRYHSCSFNISESKKTTGRACMFQHYGIPFTYTIQSSIGFYYDSEKMKTFPYEKESWLKMGSSICKGTLMYLEGYEDYEIFLKQRRDVREKKKSERILISRRTFKNDKNFDQEVEEIPSKSPLKIKYRIEQGLFMQILKNIEKQAQKNERQKFSDEDASSDDHDESQDLQISKMKELNCLLSECGNRKQRQSFSFKKEVSYNNFTNDKNDKIKQSQKQEQEEQRKYFEENIIRKIQSSHANKRPKLNPKQEPRSETSSMRRKIMKAKAYNQQKFENLQIKKDSANNSLRDSFRQKNIYNNNRTFHITMKQYENNTQFSQPQIPEVQKEGESMKFINSQMSRIRKIRESSRQQRSKPIVFSRPKQEECKSPKYLKKQNIQFNIEDLMNNLENRSQLLRDRNRSSSKQCQKPKPKSNLNFPSSFFGVKNQINTKRNQFKEASSKPKKISIEKMPLQVQKFFNQQ